MQFLKTGVTRPIAVALCIASSSLVPGTATNAAAPGNVASPLGQLNQMCLAGKVGILTVEDGGTPYMAHFTDYNLPGTEEECACFVKSMGEAYKADGLNLAIAIYNGGNERALSARYGAPAYKDVWSASRSISKTCQVGSAAGVVKTRELAAARQARSDAKQNAGLGGVRKSLPTSTKVSSSVEGFWVVLPSADEITAAYPQQARTHGFSHVVYLKCHGVNESGKVACEDKFKTDDELGFVAASVRILADHGKINTTSGQPITGAVAAVTVSWKADGVSSATSE